MSKKGKYKNLVLISQIGINSVVPVLLMTFLGKWIDDKLGYEMLFTLVFLVLGGLTGVYNIYKLGMDGTGIDKKTSDKDNN